MGTVVALPSPFPKLDSGYKGDGNFAWIKILTSKGEVNIGLVYGSYKRPKCIALWKWMETNLHYGNLFICGDLNQMEKVEDFVGPSSLMHGSKFRAWNWFADKFDLLDNRLIVVQKTGPHFTRQDTHGDRFDQSRLDKSYFSNCGSWMDFVLEKIHNATQTLSDHHPTLARIALSQAPSLSSKKTSYMKLDVEELKVENTRSILEAIWKEQMRAGRDP